MNARKKISVRQRFRILRRDGFKCQYCGRFAPAAELTVDHVVAVARGGSNDDSNLAAACIPCNQGKGTMRVSDRWNFDDWMAVADLNLFLADPHVASLYGELVV